MINTTLVSSARIVALCVSLFACVPANAQFAKLVFEDTFSGAQNAPIDSAKWRYYGLGARKDAVNVQDAVYQDGYGNLVIKTYTGSDGIHRTGMVRTNGTWKYGKFEARIKFENHLGGMWSAFWVQSPTIGNPIGNPSVAGVELDVVEYRNRNSSSSYIGNSGATNLHWDGYGANHQKKGNGSGTWSNYSGNLNDGNFHTFTLIWDSTKYQFYCDGQPVYSTTTPISNVAEFIILSSEVNNANWAGSIPAGGYGTAMSTTTKMRVDYVRVWQ